MARPASTAVAFDGAPWFNYSVVSFDGILYEDKFIQIGYQSEFTKEQGRIALYYGNTTNERMTNVTAATAQVDFVSMKFQPLPAIIEPKQQVSQQVEVVCLRDFADAPLMKVTYSVSGQNLTKVLKLPIVVTKFVIPHSFSEGDFLKNWAESSTEKITVVDTKAPPNLQYIYQVLDEGFRMGLVPGTWPPNNVVASGIFCSKPAQVPVLVRMEGRTSGTSLFLRITVRSPSANVATAVSQLFTTHFGAPTS